MMILTWLGNNLRMVALLAAIAVGTTFVVTGYSIIKENVHNQAKIVTLEKEIALKEWQIETLEFDKKLTEKLIAQRDKQLTDLETQLGELVKNLPDDINDKAPASVREYFNRLREIK